MAHISLDDFAVWWTNRISLLARTIMRHENNQLSRGAITLPQFWALECLSRKEHRMRELAAALNLTFPAATGLVDRLVKNGLADRSRSDRDRRVVRVAITRKGQGILSQVYHQRRASVKKVFGRLTDKERSQYMEIVNRLVAGLSEPGPR